MPPARPCPQHYKGPCLAGSALFCNMFDPVYNCNRTTRTLLGLFVRELDKYGYSQREAVKIYYEIIVKVHMSGRRDSDHIDRAFTVKFDDDKAIRYRSLKLVAKAYVLSVSRCICGAVGASVIICHQLSSSVISCLGRCIFCDHRRR